MLHCLVHILSRRLLTLSGRNRVDAHCRHTARQLYNSNSYRCSCHNVGCYWSLTSSSKSHRPIHHSPHLCNLPSSVLYSCKRLLRQNLWLPNIWKSIWYCPFFCNTLNIGAMICIAGIFNLVQEVLDHLVNGEIFKGNPIPVDMGLLVASILVGGAIWGYVGVQSRRRRNLRVDVHH